MSARIAADSGVIIQPCWPHSAHHLSCTVSPRAISIVWRVRIFICIRFIFTKFSPSRPEVQARRFAIFIAPVINSAPNSMSGFEHWQYQLGAEKKS